MCATHYTLNKRLMNNDMHKCDSMINQKYSFHEVNNLFFFIHLAYFSYPIYANDYLFDKKFDTYLLNKSRLNSRSLCLDIYSVW